MRIDLDELERLAKAATPQNIDAAEIIEGAEGKTIECPVCCGEGHVSLEGDYCNFDGCAIGVQFYGIGNEHSAAERYYRAANPATVIALVRRLREAEKDTARLEFMDQELTLTIKAGRLVAVSRWENGSISGRNSIRADIDAVIATWTLAKGVDPTSCSARQSNERQQDIDDLLDVLHKIARYPESRDDEMSIAMARAMARDALAQTPTPCQGHARQQEAEELAEWVEQKEKALHEKFIASLGGQEAKSGD